MSIDSGGQVAAERRKAAGRRQKDKEMEQQIKTLTEAHASIFSALQKQGEVLSRQGDQINGHIVDCSKNYVALETKVDRIDAWVAPKIKSAEAWSEIITTVKKAVITDTMTAVIKWGAIFTVLTIFLGSNPAFKKLVEWVATHGLP